MEMNEFMIAGGCLVIGVIFFVVAANYMGGQVKASESQSMSRDAQRLASLIEKVSSQPFSNSVEMNLSLCSISVEGGTLTMEQKGKKYSEFVPMSVADVNLSETASVCVVKNGDSVNLYETCPPE